MALVLLGCMAVVSCSNNFKHVPQTGFITHQVKNKDSHIPFDAYWNADDKKIWNDRVNGVDGKKVMIGFEHMEWKARCADRFISMYDYKATHRYYEDGREHTYHYVPGKNEAMSMAKSAILQKEFRNERKMLDVSYRMFRFMANPKQALIAEAKRLVKDALTGKI